MEINLKQAELFKAIRQYLQSQGFHTRGKEVTINVSGGRGNTGAWAAITIEDIDIPGFDQDSDDAPIIEMVNSDIRQLGAEDKDTDNLSPAPADATPVPIPAALYEEVKEVAELIDEPYPYAGMLDSGGNLDLSKEAGTSFSVVLDNDLKMGTPDTGLFDAPLKHEAEQAQPAPAPTPSPSSLFDE